LCTKSPLMSHPLTTWLVVNCSLKMPSFLFRNYCPASVFRTLTPPLPRSRHLCGLFHMLQGTRAPCLQSLSVHPCTICDILRAMQPLSGNQITFRRTFNIDLQMDSEWCAGDESRMPLHASVFLARTSVRTTLPVLRA
jgi:hypothetical protein